MNNISVLQAKERPTWKIKTRVRESFDEVHTLYSFPRAAVCEKGLRQKRTGLEFSISYLT